MKKLLYILLLLPVLVKGQIIITVAGTGVDGFSGDGGPAAAANLSSCYGLTLDHHGNLYVCDNGNRRIRKLSPPYGGAITTIAGNGVAGYSGDGYEAIYAEIRGVIDVAADNWGNIYLADADNNRIRKVSAVGIITTYGGTGTAGYNGDGIAATSAMLNSPISVAVDDTGNLFIGDRDNFRIRKIDTFGIITTIAGNGIAGFSPDGCRADTSSIDYIKSVRTDKHGILFFGDNARIRKLDNEGKFVTIAGIGEFGYSGENGPATAAKIETTAFCFDTSGNCYITGPSSRIRKIGTNDTIITIAGYGYSGFAGDWGDPLLAKFASPQGIAVAPNGDIFISDLGNDRVRMITNHVTAQPEVATIQYGLRIYPNPAEKQFKVLIKTPNETMADVTITDMTGRELARCNIKTNSPAVIDTSWPVGIYVVCASIGRGYYTGKIEIK